MQEVMFIHPTIESQCSSNTHAHPSNIWVRACPQTRPLVRTSPLLAGAVNTRLASGFSRSRLDDSQLYMRRCHEHIEWTHITL